MEQAGARSLLIYTIGFICSMALTLAAYWLVVTHVLQSRVLVAAIISLAIVQLFAQMVFFLHLGQEARPRLNLLLFGFMAAVLMIMVVGSLWIMNHLNYHMMQGSELTNYIINDEGVHH